MKKKVFRERYAVRGMTFTVDEPTDEVIEELNRRQEERIKKALGEEVKKLRKRASKKKESGEQ